MAEVGIKELLEAGVHFGHQTRRWNPNMRRFIFGERDGIHIIDLLQTDDLLDRAVRFAGETASGGGTILFVGTKKQARDTVKEWAEKSNMPYVHQRWLGGLLTNFNTISQRIARLHELTELQEGGQLELLPTKERMGMQAELAKLEYNLGGVRDMQRLPDAVFVIDLKTEEIAVREANRLRIPVIGLVDSNCDPTGIDYVIPGNDDAIRSCNLIVSAIGSAVEEGSGVWRAEEERKRAEEEERRRVAEEERRKREEEEKARQEAEEAQRAEAEAAAAASGGEGAAAGAAGSGETAPASGTPTAAAPPAGQTPPAEQPQTAPEATPGVTETKAPEPSAEQPPPAPEESQKGADEEGKA